MATQSLNNETTSNNRENALFCKEKKKFEKWMALMCIGTQKRGHKAATVTQVAIGYFHIKCTI